MGVDGNIGPITNDYIVIMEEMMRDIRGTVERGKEVCIRFDDEHREERERTSKAATRFVRNVEKLKDHFEDILFRIYVERGIDVGIDDEGFGYLDDDGV